MHNVMHESYPERVNKGDVQAEWDHYAYMEDWQEGCSGVSPIRWLESVICDTYEDAEKKIEELDKGWYDCLAVKYRVPKKNKAAEDASERVNEAHKAYNTLKEKVKSDFISAKSTMAGCKKCKSSLNRRYLKSAICPVCGATMLSNTAIERLESAKARIAKAQANQQEVARKNAKKSSELMWLVKIEYHT